MLLLGGVNFRDRNGVPLYAAHVVLGMLTRFPLNALPTRRRRFYSLLRDRSAKEGHLPKRFRPSNPARWPVDWYGVYVVLIVDIGASCPGSRNSL